MPGEPIQDGYVHGYGKREVARLVDQGNALTDLLEEVTRRLGREPPEAGGKPCRL